MTQEKIHIEKFITKSFFNKVFQESLNENDLDETDHLKNEPDIIYDNIGVEIGALLSSENMLKDKYVVDFLKKLNQEILDKIDSNIIVKLYFQIDKQSLTYAPIEKNKQSSKSPSVLISVITSGLV